MPIAAMWNLLQQMSLTASGRCGSRKAWVSLATVSILSVPLALALRHRAKSRRIAELLQNAEVHLKADAYDKAQALFQHSKELAVSVYGINHPSYALSVFGLGRCRHNLGDYEQAKADLLLAKQIQEEALGENHPDHAMTLTCLATVYYSVGAFDQAEPLFLQAMEIQGKTLGKEHIEYAKSLKGLAAMYLVLGMYDKAESSFVQAKSIFAKVLGRGHQQYAACVLNLGMVCQAMGALKKSEHLYMEAKGIIAEVLGKEHPYFSRSLYALAGLYYTMGTYEKAERFYVMAKEILVKTVGEEHPDCMACWTQLGQVYYLMGEYDRAEPLYLHALQLQAKTLGKDHLDHARTLHALGNLYISMGAYEKAERYFLEAKEVRGRALGEEHPDFAGTLSGIADSYFNRADYEKAETLYLRASQIQQNVFGEDHPECAVVLVNLAHLYCEMDAYEKAERLYLRSKEIRAKALGEDDPIYASVLTSLAACYKLMGSYKNAEALYLQANEIRAKVLGDEHVDYTKSLNDLAELYLVMGSHNSAAHLFMQASDAQFRTLSANLLRLPEKRRLQYLFALEAREDGLIELTLRHLRECQSSKECCFTIVLQRKNLAFDAFFAGSSLELQKAGQPQMSWDDDITPGAAVASSFQSEVSPTPQEAMQTAICNVVNPLGTKARAVFEALPRGTALVDYVLYRAAPAKGHRSVGPLHYIAFVTEAGQEKVNMLDIGPAEEVEAEIKECYRMAVRKVVSKPKYRAVGERVRQRVLDPVMATLSTSVQHLLVAPAGELTKLPLVVLPSGENGHVLDWDVLISYLTSGRDVLRLAANDPSSSAASPALIVAAPDFGLKTSMSEPSHAANDSMIPSERYPDRHAAILREMREAQRPCMNDFRGVELFKDLPGTLVEGKRVAALLSEGQVALGPATLLLGPAATASAVLGCAGPLVLHVATHGFFLPVQPCTRNSMKKHTRLETELGQAEDPMLRSGLALAGARAWQEGCQLPAEAGDGLLTARQLRAANLHGTRLVTLSACDTGLGDAPRGQGVLGLGSALQLAGAESVLLSLWAIPDACTADLMEAFYSHLLPAPGGPQLLGRAEALRTAQRKIRDAQSAHSVASWGAFVLYGGYGRLI